MNPPTEIKIPQLPKLLTEDQLAQSLSVCPRHISNLRAQRLIRFIRLGRLVRFDPAQVLEDLQNLTVHAGRVGQ